MDTSQKTNSEHLMHVISGQGESAVGITSSPSNTLDITIDITETSKTERTLGQMVYAILEEDGENILVIGQIIEVQTKNRWHEDPSFKGVIKRHGKLPHLSGTADNRIATISVQACYNLGNNEPISHILGASPSTGEKIQKMNNEVMTALMKNHETDITFLGKVYGTNVDLPFWFKHFDKGDRGAGDAHHIGVFGKSGSGKSVTAAYMLLGYAKNKDYMNILLIDPQGQFYFGKDFPDDFDFDQKIKDAGVNLEKYSILEDLYLPSSEYELFASLLQKNKFIRRVFGIHSDRENEASFAIADYLITLNRNSKGRYGNLNYLNEDSSKALMNMLLKRFAKRDSEAEDEDEGKGKKKKSKASEYNRYVEMIYSGKGRLDQLMDQLQRVIEDDNFREDAFVKYWHPVVKYFMSVKSDGNKKHSIESIINKIANEEEKGNFIILNISGEKEKMGSDNIKAMFVRIIENKVKEIGERFYEENKKVNCLVVMDEAARFIARDSSDAQITELTKEIIDSVRTTRKYGIGYMFITQTIESLDKEILQQTRIFAFGYGLTSGSEIRVLKDLINNDSALQLYRSFIDPSSNKKYPFMFFGPVSPLSFTGSPLFLEVYTDPADFK